MYRHRHCRRHCHRHCQGTVKALSKHCQKHCQGWASIAADSHVSTVSERRCVCVCCACSGRGVRAGALGRPDALTVVIWQRERERRHSASGAFWSTCDFASVCVWGGAVNKHTHARKHTCSKLVSQQGGKSSLLV